MIHVNVNDGIIYKKMINRGFYNRYIGEAWLWMIFVEWIYTCYTICV